MLRNTTDVFRKTMNFDVWQMVDPIKVGVGLSGTIASHLEVDSISKQMSRWFYLKEKI
jgi:hypothetical protein